MTLCHEVRAYLQSCYRAGETARIKELAQRMGTTPLKLSRQFKRLTGVRLKDYLIEQQLTRADELRRSSGLKAHQIARLSGFGHRDNLTRATRTRSSQDGQ